ncbi:MAG: putative ABC transporter permease [Coriobacteriales bacterium]|nr:putative ABC transporter permease [Coriobacteriales bacterium]
MGISAYIILFAVCSIVGWIFETVYSIIHSRKWERRGFLFGPLCPIYGVGVVALILLEQCISYFGFSLTWWGVALISFFGSMVLELITYWILEKFFHAYWWDYSNLPLNYKGKICIPASLAFAAGGLLAIYVVKPLWVAGIGLMHPVLVDIIAYIIVIIMTIDCTVTINALSDFERKVSALDNQFNEQMSGYVDTATEARAEKLNALKQKSTEFYETHIQAIVQDMTPIARNANERVKGFRLPSYSRAKEILDNLRSRTKRPK